MVKEDYISFLKSKIPTASITGFEVDKLNNILWRHQPDIVRWALSGGRRAIFASFGLGKTMMQLEIANQVCNYTGKPFLIGLPLGVRYEFELDADKMGYNVAYVTSQKEVDSLCQSGVQIFISNYEQIRSAKFNPQSFGGVSFDEAAVLRNLDTQTTDYILEHYTKVPYRFVCTATPSPNEYTEILNYAHFLGIMDRGQALTRFFQRDSTKAGNLTLHEHKTNEFWRWVSTWAVFITMPSDLGYSDDGYDLPSLKIHYHKVTVTQREIMTNRDSQIILIPDASAGLIETAREKRNSIEDRLQQALSILELHPNESFLLWHHLEAERKAIEAAIPECKTVYGTQKEELREDYLVGFGRGDYKYLATKPEIAGEGCNFQRFCNNAIFLGIDYKFKDFIQAVHRIYRFMQMHEVHIHLIYTDIIHGVNKVRRLVEAKDMHTTGLIQRVIQLLNNMKYSNQ